MPGERVNLLELLRCPRCGGRLTAAGELRCDNGHAYSMRGGVPRLVEDGWQEGTATLVTATGQAFGRQWSSMADDAGVARDDLILHLPSHLDTTVFDGLCLDAGCGMGRYASLVHASGGDVIGLDLSHAVDTAALRWPDIPFVQADIVRPPFEPATFDTVFSFGVLHHLPDPARGFRACFELVRPGGLLLVWVYSDHGGMFRRGRRSARRLVRRVPVLQPPVAWAAALAIWGGYLAPRRALRRRGGRLSFYKGKGLRQIHVDCYDALNAPTEVYLTADDCRDWLSSLDAADGGFERRGDGSGWILWARRRGESRQVERAVQLPLVAAASAGSA
jgi:SAM-dependent methyltransferase